MDCLPDWIADKIIPEPMSGCWIWLGALGNHGYGVVSVPTYRTELVHRLVYEILVRKIPEGLTLDHLCRVRPCCNPEHLEPKTLGENVLCGEGIPAVNARKTHCVNGHEFSTANTCRRQRPGRNPERYCIACNRESFKRYKARREDCNARSS